MARKIRKYEYIDSEKTIRREKDPLKKGDKVLKEREEEAGKMMFGEGYNG